MTGSVDESVLAADADAGPVGAAGSALLAPLAPEGAAPGEADGLRNRIRQAFLALGAREVRPAEPGGRYPTAPVTVRVAPSASPAPPATPPAD